MPLSFERGGGGGRYEDTRVRLYEREPTSQTAAHGPFPRSPWCIGAHCSPPSPKELGASSCLVSALFAALGISRMAAPHVKIDTKGTLNIENVPPSAKTPRKPRRRRLHGSASHTLATLPKSQATDSLAWSRENLQQY